MADTTNFGWTKPTVGGDTGAWGGILNTLFDDVDIDVDAIKTTADAALPKAGGVLTGQVENKTDRYVTIDKGTMTGAVTLDYNDANYFFGVKIGAVTLTFDNPPASGKWAAFFLEITNGGNTGTLTYPASVDWPGGSAPVLQVTGLDILMFTTRDGGTIWHGSLTNADSQ